MSDTIPTPVANEDPADQRGKPTTDGETLVAVTAGHFRIDVKKRTVFFIVSVLTTLSGGAFVKSCQTDDSVTAVQEKVEVVEDRAELAKDKAVQAAVVVEESYQATKEKLEPTSEELVQLRKDVDQLLEAEAERARRAGRRSRRVVAKPVPPAVTQPLPDTAAAAAAVDAKPSEVKSDP